MSVQKKPPPPVIGSERVLAYALVDKTMTYTGRQRLYVDDHLIGAVPCVAIGKSLNKKIEGFLILYCDKKWNPLGLEGAGSITAAIGQVERYYQGISGGFIRVSNTEKAARKWLAQKHPDSLCSFCRRMYFETEAMFYGGNVRICSNCVDEFSEQLKFKRETFD